MSCWLMYLQEVSEKLKSLEPDKFKRKALAFELMKDVESEKGHDEVKNAVAIEDWVSRAKAKLRKKRRWEFEGEGVTEEEEAMEGK